MLRLIRNQKPASLLRSSFRGFASSANDPLPLGLANNDALTKYRAKLQARAEKEGFKTVEELLLNGSKKAEKPKPIEGAIKPKAGPLSPQPTQTTGGVAPTATGAPRVRNDGLPSYVKTLDEIVDLQRFADETPERIEIIWNEFHATQAGMVSGVMQSDFYSKLKARGKENPLFILPLPRESGVEFFLLQFSFNQIYYTSLLEYKTHMTEARPCLTLTHYDDLSESKKIVMMCGEIGKEGGILRADDARLLVLMTQSFYVTGSEAKRKLVEVFNKNPSEFNYQTLIEEMDKLE
ncbi:UNVERIFIED_CONTAM: hypothetical protein HDU68_002050 [Siphonaria sp. JEL0065]|nr:hypothetical protein HDU68_002050 [Siphonaria sp. JEL0065]